MNGTRRGFFALGLGLTLLAMVVAPASAARQHAQRGTPTKFGANLTTHTQPSNSSPPHSCHDADSDLTAAACTRLMLSSEIGSPDNHLKAPANGVITSIWVIAGHSGHFTPVVGFLSGVSGATGNGKITAKGPVINHGDSFTSGSDFKILKFPVSINVKKGESLGIRDTTTSILRCDQGSTRQLLFQPPLVVGAAPVANGGDDDCSLLIEAVMNPA